MFVLKCNEVAGPMPSRCTGKEPFQCLIDRYGYIRFVWDEKLISYLHTNVQIHTHTHTHTKLLSRYSERVPEPRDTTNLGQVIGKTPESSQAEIDR